MKPVYADLHVHSLHSDGSETPAELAARANRNGLRALALTDHDMVTGIPELIASAQHMDLEIVPGVEISTDVDGKRIHVLGYYIDIKSPELRDLLTYIGQLRTENTRLIFENLRELGMVDYSWQRVLKHSDGKQWLANTDVFRAMLADGQVSHWSEASEFYHRYFGPKSPAYVELGGVSAVDAVKAIIAADGIPVVAHPKLIGDDTQIEKLISHGLRGIEVFYPAHDQEDVKRYSQLARRHNLLQTGGTDWHGLFTEWDVELGEVGLDEAGFQKLSNH